MNHTTYVNGLAFVNKMVLDYRAKFEKMNCIVFSSNLLDVVANQMSVENVEDVLNAAYRNAEIRLNELIDNNQMTPEIQANVMFEFKLVDEFKTMIEAVA